MERQVKGPPPGKGPNKDKGQKNKDKEKGSESKKRDNVMLKFRAAAEMIGPFTIIDFDGEADVIEYEWTDADGSVIGTGAHWSDVEYYNYLVVAETV